MNHQISLLLSNQILLTQTITGFTLSNPQVTPVNNNTETKAIQLTTMIQYNTTTTNMDNSTGINQSRSNQQFGMALTSITDYKNNLFMTLLGVPQG